MGRHTITAEQLHDWIDREVWVRFASSFNSDSHKTFEMSNAGKFRVTDHQSVAYEGDSEVTAIEIYNAAL